MRMAFDRLELHNYRYYYGTQEIIFSTSPDKNVIVVKGDNGAGKSNILNALTWCLYNDEIHIDKKSGSLPVMNTQYIAELANSRCSGDVSVCLVITVDDKLWEIKRTITGYGERSPDWTEEEPKYLFHESNRLLQVSFSEDGNYKTEINDAAQSLIDTLLPLDLRSFFFIDGEQLHEFFKKDTAGKLRSSIEKLSQLELINDIYDSLSEYKVHLIRTMKSNTPEEEKIKSELLDIEEKLKRFRSDKNHLSKRINEIKASIDEIDEFIKAYDVKAIQKLSADIRERETKISVETKTLESIRKEKNDYILKAAPVILLKDKIKEAYNTIDVLIERGTLPPGIRETFIHQLLNKGKCICGRPIDKNSDEWNVLSDYAEKIQISEMDGIAHEGRLEFEKCFDLIREFPEKISDYNNRIADSEKYLDRLNDELDGFKEDLEGQNIEEINIKTKEKDKLNKDLGSCELKLRSAESQINTYESKRLDADRKFEREKEKSKTNQLYSKKVDLVKSTLNVLERVMERVKATIRLSLEENTKKHFLSFLREDGLFRDVKINDNYQVSVINNEGWDNLGSLSAGQYLILGYAFVVALRAITGYQAPVIVDTPLGKLDSTHQDKITKYLPELLDKTQVVFLVTSSEFTETVKTNFSKYMGDNSHYEIQKYENKTSARLIHVK